MSKKASKKSLLRKITLIFVILGSIAAWKGYNIIFKPNVFLKDNTSTYDFKVPSGTTFDQLTEMLKTETNIKSVSNFKILANFLDLDKKLKPGMYVLSNGINNKDIIRLFISGKRKEVKIRIGFNRYTRDIISDIAPKIEASEDELLALLSDEEYLNNLGFSRYTIICMFLQDTYFMYWETSAQDFFERMHGEYLKFWTKERIQKAQAMGLKPTQVMTLASIVDQETNKNDEKSRIAGVYLNRLRRPHKDLPQGFLQADPTVKYAIGDFDLKRIRSKHTSYASVYNTYYSKGLPPGPICTPSKAGIDAVLNYEKHDYFFFCARPDYSGYHQFAKDFRAHLVNARRYQRWLNSEGY